MSFPLTKQTQDDLLRIKKDFNIALEGNVLKILKDTGEVEFRDYVDVAAKEDEERRRKRLGLTLAIQAKNRELEINKKELEQKTDELTVLVEQLEAARSTAETARHSAENDLNILQKRTQNMLLSRVVSVSLCFIFIVICISTVLFYLTLERAEINTVMVSFWTNIMLVVISNSFTAVSVVTGVRQALRGKDDAE